MLTIRNTQKSEYRKTEEITRNAFWNLYFPECDEHHTTHLIRKHEEHMPELDLVAVEDGEIVGHIIYSRPWLKNDDNTLNTLTFGPVCVVPGLQRK